MAALTRTPLRPVRRTVQIGLLALWCLTPWFHWFRMDVQDQTITYFGRTWPMEMPYVLGLIVPFVATVWILAALSYAKGRVFCGWACPYGTCVELFDGLRTALASGTHRKVAALKRRSALHRFLLQGGAALTLLAGPALLALSLAAYLWSPAKILATLGTAPGRGGTLQTAVYGWILLVYLVCLVAGWLVRFHFCRYVCIYGMGQAMAAGTANPRTILRPRFQPEALEACGGCQACLKACFVDLDPREKNLQLGFGHGCFNCGDCVDICATVQAHKGGGPLLSFRSGKAK